MKRWCCEVKSRASVVQNSCRPRGRCRGRGASCEACSGKRGWDGRENSSFFVTATLPAASVIVPPEYRKQCLVAIRSRAMPLLSRFDSIHGGGGDSTRVYYRGGALFVAAREVAQANAMAFLASVADRTPGKVPCSVPPSRLRSSATADCSEWEPAQRHRTRKVSNFGHRFFGTSSWSGPVDRFSRVRSQTHPSTSPRTTTCASTDEPPMLAPLRRARCCSVKVHGLTCTAPINLWLR